MPRGQLDSAETGCRDCFCDRGAAAGHESWVLSVDVHPDGNAFVTGSSDSKVRLFDLQSRTCAQTIAEHSDQVRRRDMFCPCSSCFPLCCVASISSFEVGDRPAVPC